jgi:hypothetical protein
MPGQESDVAKQSQSEPSLSLDRRQLLAAAAALSIGNIPGAEAAVEATTSGPAVIVAEIPTSDSPAWNIYAGTAQKIEEIVARNVIRAEAGLPLLSVARELRRMKQAADATAFEQFADLHGQAVWDEVLGRCGKPGENRIGGLSVGWKDWPFKHRSARFFENGSPAQRQTG